MTSGNRYSGLPASVIAIASKKTRELCYHKYFSYSDFDDLQQELVMIMAISGYEFQNESEERATAKTIVDNRAKKLIRERSRKKRGGDISLCSLDDSIANASEDTDLLLHDYGAGTNFKTIEFELDLTKTINQLPSDLRELYELLQTRTLAEIAQLTGVSYLKLYRMSKKLRVLLTSNIDADDKDF